MESKKPSFASPSAKAPADKRASDGKRKKELNIEDFKKKLEECRKQKEEYLAGWQRARADFLNYKKKEMESIGELIKYASGGLILKILPILDNFEIVEKKISTNLKNDENIKGLLQIKTQLSGFLKNQGIEEIKCLGEKFDPNLHEVVEGVELKDKESGIVIEEIRKGYKIHGKVLRPTKVKISK
ncbi:nucleotide exchange factor GrpE [Patescibacteria group bacterium]|nr:nucleotide exchange factor GrpE [Patescibacteria group bacterium]